jgi:hypothetical protein
VPFSLLPESPRRMPLLAYAWTAAAIVYVLLWVAKLLGHIVFMGAVLFGPEVSQPLTLWSWFAGPLFVLTWFVEWRRGYLRMPWGHVAAALLWLSLIVSLPRLLTWLASGTVLAALMTVGLFVLPLALSVTMMRLIADGEARAA